MKKLKSIVTDTYDFPTLIRNGNVYVDKTAFLHRLISRVDGSFFFMSRPRRFGKSLMISTLERADAVIETEKAVYIFEFKCGKTAKAALKQIGAKGYGKPYAADKRRVMAIGVNYDPRKAGIEVISEVVNPSDEVVNPVDEVVNEVVKSHPGLRKPELVPLVGKSRATVERALASLISSGRIEFRGAPKNGGYYVISGER